VAIYYLVVFTVHVDVDSRIFGKQSDITRLSHLFISCTRKREDEQHMYPILYLFGEMLGRTVWMEEESRHRKRCYIDRQSADVHIDLAAGTFGSLQTRTRTVLDPSTQQFMSISGVHFRTLYATQSRESRDMSVLNVHF
jgi:hypothetical protein